MYKMIVFLLELKIMFTKIVPEIIFLPEVLVLEKNLDILKSRLSYF